MGDEYIKRRDVLIKLEIAYDMARLEQKLPISDLQHEVNLIKAADVQPVVRGKWNTHDVVKVLCSGETLDGFCQCTACGDVFSLHYSEYNYCPNCGARMDGDTNG